MEPLETYHRKLFRYPSPVKEMDSREALNSLEHGLSIAKDIPEMTYTSNFLYPYSKDFSAATPRWEYVEQVVGNEDLKPP